MAAVAVGLGAGRVTLLPGVPAWGVGRRGETVKRATAWGVTEGRITLVAVSGGVAVSVAVALTAGT